ncbi:MAG: hypothetical protein ACRENP_05720 [Longimicrobiales bacterium]
MTPFDAAIKAIDVAGYHNHRLEAHSDTVSKAFFEDLLKHCEHLRDDFARDKVRVWLNVQSPGDRLRKVDLFVGEPGPHGGPDIQKVRIALENKSVITAHRNRTNRFDDLKKVLGAIHAARPEALILGTVLIGLAERVLNVPDQVRPRFLKRGNDEEFQARVLPRLSSGDASLWKEFEDAVSYNRPNDPARTLELLTTLPTRKPGHTHVEGFDYLLGVPVFIDNVNPPSMPRPNTLGINVDAEYARMLEQVCAAYRARWHL